MEKSPGVARRFLGVRGLQNPARKKACTDFIDTTLENLRHFFTFAEECRPINELGRKLAIPP
jgi:hypothetical protein